MRRIISALLASAPIALASPTVFSVHDDLLAFPQYEVVFSDSLISDSEAHLIIERASSGVQDVPKTANTKSIETPGTSPHSSSPQYAFDPEHETYELMYLNNEQHFCTIPIVETPPKNETSEAEARVAEQKELARATDRGWELLQELEGECLYFISGWWSYSFCYNRDITQFHALPPQPGKAITQPVRDPATKQYVLGKAKGKESKEDEWGNEVDVRKGKEANEPPQTELQVKGDTRYLVQKMEGGTTCDLTGKPRRIEIQFHCNPHVTDRIGYIKEVTTCSYLMVVYTPRLCSDVAFLPQKENKANSIVCRVVVPEDELQERTEQKNIENELAAQPKDKKTTYVGGLVLGGGKWMNKEGQRMPIPANFGKEPLDRTVEIIARAKSKAEGGQVEVVSDAQLRRLDLDPKAIEELKKEMQLMAKEKGWHIQVVNEPGQIMEIMGIVDGTNEGDLEDDDDEEGSEETFYKDEL